VRVRGKMRWCGEQDAEKQRWQPLYASSGSAEAENVAAHALRRPVPSINGTGASQCRKRVLRFFNLAPSARACLPVHVAQPLPPAHVR